MQLSAARRSARLKWPTSIPHIACCEFGWRSRRTDANEWSRSLSSGASSVRTWPRCASRRRPGQCQLQVARPEQLATLERGRDAAESAQCRCSAPSRPSSARPSRAWPRPRRPATTAPSAGTAPRPTPGSGGSFTPTSSRRRSRATRRASASSASATRALLAGLRELWQHRLAPAVRAQVVPRSAARLARRIVPGVLRAGVSLPRRRARRIDRRQWADGPRQLASSSGVKSARWRPTRKPASRP